MEYLLVEPAPRELFPIQTKSGLPASSMNPMAARLFRWLDERLGADPRLLF
jgi:hypothetical protein